MKIMSTLGAAALLVVSPAFAQETPAAPDAARAEGQPEAAAPANPHSMLPALTGGPLGSPTALRGNPVPGTSTSIPTTNPARVMPLPVREGKPLEREDTGIDGQCDPVVSLGACPERPASTAAQNGMTDADAVE